jgi:hypothetical protein
MKKMIKEIIRVIFSGENLKEFMLNQIYPAFLGSFIFLIFQGCYTFFSQGNFLIDLHFFYKVISLLIILTFFFCDYYYIKYTNNYVWWFFIFDLVFCALLLCSVYFLNFENAKVPKTNYIFLSFLIFIILYFIWDLLEYTKAKGKEKKFYCWVILWEITSLILLLIGIKFSHFTFLSLLLILPIITIAFVFISYRKKEFFVEIKSDIA